MLSQSAIDAVAEAVFGKPDPWVAEAYSSFDAEPLLFSSSEEVAGYMRKSLAHPGGLGFVFVVYPDMRGHAVRRTIHLKSGSVPGHTLRYTWDGLGLISVQLAREGVGSRVVANSQARAETWASTYPDWDGPGVWNWNAVASHTRRLQRVLKRFV